MVLRGKKRCRHRSRHPGHNHRDPPQYRIQCHWRRHPKYNCRNKDQPHCRIPYHRPIDIHDPVRNANSSGFLPEERKWMSLFLESGFTDTFRYFHPEEPHQYTWWSFRANARNNNKGWRIDYCMVSPEVIPLLKDAYILPQVKHSDHCPAVVELKVL